MKRKIILRDFSLHIRIIDGEVIACLKCLKIVYATLLFLYTCSLINLLQNVDNSPIPFTEQTNLL